MHCQFLFNLVIKKNSGKLSVCAHTACSFIGKPYLSEIKTEVRNIGLLQGLITVYLTLPPLKLQPFFRPRKLTLNTYTKSLYYNDYLTFEIETIG